MGLHMGHVALEVEDLDVYVDHVTRTLGLKVLERAEDGALLGLPGRRYELQLIRGPAPAFSHVGLCVETEPELHDVLGRALGAGAEIISPPASSADSRLSVMITDPVGIAYELYVPSRPLTVALGLHLDDHLRRLGHLNFASSSADALAAFWGDGLGFRVSDQFDGITWMRCDSYHHSFAVMPHRETTVLHHHAWEAQDMAALAKHCDRNGLEGRAQMWGPVRHGPGFNIATYMPDAAGALIEVYTDLLTIEDDASYVPSDWSNEPGALNLWGPPPGDDLLAAGIPLAASKRTARA